MISQWAIDFAVISLAVSVSITFVIVTSLIAVNLTVKRLPKRSQVSVANNQRVPDSVASDDVSAVLNQRLNSLQNARFGPSMAINRKKRVGEEQ